MSVYREVTSLVIATYTYAKIVSYKWLKIATKITKKPSFICDRVVA